MKFTGIDLEKLNYRAKESFANSLIHFGTGAVKYALFVLLILPATIFVKLILHEKDVVSFMWENVNAFLLLLAISAVGMFLGALFRDRGVMLLNELPESHNRIDYGE